MNKPNHCAVKNTFTTIHDPTHEGLQKQPLLRRLKIIEGQIRGLQDMIEQEKYCIDVITQTSAVKQALSQVEDILLEHHLSHCAVQQMQNGEVDKATLEILTVYRLKRK